MTNLNKLVFKPKVIQATPKRKRSNKVYNKKLYCVCIEDGEKVFAKLVVGKEELILPFTERSDDLKGKTTIFTKFKDKTGNIIKIIRDKNSAFHFPSTTEYYTIFRRGYVYSGYVVKDDDDIQKFDVIDIEEHISNCPQNIIVNKIEKWKLFL